MKWNYLYKTLMGLCLITTISANTFAIDREKCKKEVTVCVKKNCFVRSKHGMQVSQCITDCHSQTECAQCKKTITQCATNCFTANNQANDGVQIQLCIHDCIKNNKCIQNKSNGSVGMPASSGASTPASSTTEPMQKN